MKLSQLSTVELFLKTLDLTRITIIDFYEKNYGMYVCMWIQ